MIYSNRLYKKYQTWILAGLILLAILLRFKLITGSTLLPGVNGGYYPLMVKSLLSSHSLPFKDAPLVFWLESLMSRILFIFMNNHDSAIILSGRIVDAVFLPLAAIPIFSLAMRKTKNLSFSLVISGFLILFFPASYLLTGDLHKNALAVVWLSAFFASIEGFRDKPAVKNLILPVTFLILLALSHFGTLTIGLLALPLIVSPLYKVARPLSNLNILVFLLLLGSRVDRLAGIMVNPLRLFEHPVLWYILDGQNILTPVLLGFGLCIQALSILILINGIFTRKGIYWAVLAVFLSSPFIGIEWYVRLSIMAHIPLVLAITCQWKSSKILAKKSIVSGLLLMTLISVFLSFNGRRKTSISQEELNDLKKIKVENLVTENDMIICSHGTEWWTAWFLQCYIAQEQAINPDDFDSYNRVMTLSRADNAKTSTRGQSNFADPISGDDAIIIFEGDHLVLKEVFDSSFSYINPDEKLISVGHLSLNKKGTWQVTNPLYTNPLIFDNIQMRDSLELRVLTCPDLSRNTEYRIYGSRQAFSLNIKVSHIEAISNASQEI